MQIYRRKFGKKGERHLQEIDANLKSIPEQNRGLIDNCKENKCYFVGPAYKVLI